MDCSLPGSSVHGIFQARVLEWGAIAFSNELDLYNTDLALYKKELNFLLSECVLHVLFSLEVYLQGDWQEECTHLKCTTGDFPGGAVVKSLSFCCRVQEFNSWLGN